MAEELKDTLNLPVTDFPMRAGLAEREPVRIAHWERHGLYGQIQARAAGKPPPSTVVAEAPPAFTPAEGYHQNFWAKARMKLGALCLLLLLRVPGTPELSCP